MKPECGHLLLMHYAKMNQSSMADDMDQSFQIQRSTTHLSVRNLSGI